MPKTANPIPKGYHTVTLALVVKDAARAIDYYKRALGATERERMNGPDGRIMHAEIQIGDSIVFLSDEFPMGQCKSPQSLGGTTASVYLYVEDVDTAFKRAVEAGGTVGMPVADQFWGDRYGMFTDPFGHQWGLATHKEDLKPEEIRKRGEAFFAEMSQRAKAA